MVKIIGKPLCVAIQGSSHHKHFNALSLSSLDLSIHPFAHWTSFAYIPLMRCYPRSLSISLGLLASSNAISLSLALSVPETAPFK